MEKFTRELCELYVNKNMSVTESLYLMSCKPKGKVKKTSEFLYKSLEKGIPLSNALKNNPYIDFDRVYVMFILFAEQSGNLKRTIQYLDSKCKRSRDNKTKVITAFLYPAFVVFLSFFLCLFLNRFLQVDHKEKIYKAFFFLIIVCSFLFILIYKMIGNNRLYEAFLGTDILVKSGISVSAAAECGAMIVGINSKIGKLFMDAGEKIEYGMNLKTAFNFNGEFEDAFYYADVTGGENDVFEKVAFWIKEKLDKRRIICMQLIEPLFIAVTGSFLLILVFNFFLPVMNNYNWL